MRIFSQQLRSLCLVLGILFSSILTATGIRAQPTLDRTLTLDDLFSTQQIGCWYGGFVAFSPDGQQLAFVIQRPRQTAKLHTGGVCRNYLSDIYIVSSSGGKPVNITNGANDGAGYWAPSWSPDGKHLAMLSTKDGNVHLWLWDKGSGSPQRLTGNGVNLDFYWPLERPYVWVSASTLLVPELPQGERPTAFLAMMRASEQASALWPKTFNGNGAAVSVLQSGSESDFSKRPQGDLRLIDINTRQSRTVTTGSARAFAISPDKQVVAYARRVDVYQPEANVPLPSDYLYRGFKLELASIDGKALSLDDPSTYNVIPTSLRWSPDSGDLAFLTYTKSNQDVPQLAHFLRSSHTFRVDRIAALDFSSLGRQPQLEWTEQGWLLLASATAQGATTRASTRREWWLVGRDGGLRSLTDSMPTVPTKLWREADGDSYVGLAAGDLWRISAAAPPENVTASFGHSISAIVWPRESRGGDAEAPRLNEAYRELVISARSAELEEMFLFNLASKQATKISRPATNATLAGYSPISRAMLYYANDRTGLHLWLGGGSKLPLVPIFEANAFLKQVVPGSTQKISYKSLDGRDLNGWLLLPPGYQRGMKCPLIVWTYPGWMAGQSPDELFDIGFAHALNLQIPAARGYAVLRPSMPLNAGVDDPMLKLTAGVLPAIDKVIDLGIADPERIFVMGQSMGGFATYGLITQTHRFKAAVALAGYTNLISAHGGLESDARYEDYPHETDSLQRTIEEGLHIGSPPWKDLGRYLRNSPIFYVDRVQTPLMIIHGDMDGVPIQQAEEFFMSLYQQGKRAKFVRYWGEGHVVESPPNVKDMWNRIFDWFEEFSPKPEDRKPAGGEMPN